jgi:hypothetical protein
MRKNLSRPVMTFGLLLVACAGPNDRVGASAGQAESTSPPPIYFNHVEAFVSQATVAAMQSSSYLNGTFSDVQVRTTVRPDLTYTGTYLNFHDTYLEFFPFGTFGAPNGESGIGQSDEVAGGYQAILAEMEAQFGKGNATNVLISRQLPDGDGGTVMTPWFQQDFPNWDNLSATFGVWTEEYVPPVPGSTAPGTRSQFLAPRYAPDKLAENVEVAVLALADADRANLLATWQALGVSTVTLGTMDDGDGGTIAKSFTAFTANDPDTARVYYIEPADGTRQGAIGYAIHLNGQSWESHVEQLGDATLTVSPDGTPFAYLWLTPPTAAEQAMVGQLATSGGL